MVRLIKGLLRNRIETRAFDRVTISACGYCVRKSVRIGMAITASPSQLGMRTHIFCIACVIERIVYQLREIEIINCQILLIKLIRRFDAIG